MKSAEILELVRAGYSKAEIDAMFDESVTQHDAPAEQHDAPAEQHDAPAEQHDAPAEQHDGQHDEPAWVKALNDTLADLRKTVKDMQASNARYDDMGDELDSIDAGEAALAEYITGKKPEPKKKGRG